MLFADSVFYGTTPPLTATSLSTAWLLHSYPVPGERARYVRGVSGATGRRPRRRTEVVLATAAAASDGVYTSKGDVRMRLACPFALLFLFPPAPLRARLERFVACPASV